MSWSFENQKLLKDGKEIYLQGAGIGNWLLLEAFMLGIPGQDSQMRAVLAEELGADRAQQFWTWFEDSYFTEKDMAFLKSRGCNCIRIPFNQRIFEEEDRPGVYKQRGFELLDRVFSWAEKHEQWILLDMHAVLGSQSTDWYADCVDGQAHFWKRPDFQQRALDLWATLAEHYHPQPRLLGYDILCEPVQPDSSAINAYYHRAIAAIRQHDREHIIQLEPNHWARDAQDLDASLFEDPLVMVHGHWYAFQHLSGEDPAKATEEYILNGVQSVLDPERINRPGMIGEYGHMHQRRPDPVHLEIVSRQAQVMEKAGIHRMLWSAKDRGSMGILYPKTDTPWIRFLSRPEIAGPLEQLENLTRCAFGANEGFIRENGGDLQRRCHELFPNLEGEIIPRQVMEAHRALDVLALRHLAREMKKLSNAELQACAESFHFDHCEVHEDYAAIMGPTAG